jgi:hypothetical protein
VCEVFWWFSIIKISNFAKGIMQASDWLVPLCADQGFCSSDLKRSGWFRSEHTSSIKWSNPGRLNEIRRLEKEGRESSPWG